MVSKTVRKSSSVSSATNAPSHAIGTRDPDPKKRRPVTKSQDTCLSSGPAQRARKPRPLTPLCACLLPRSPDSRTHVHTRVTTHCHHPPPLLSLAHAGNAPVSDLDVRWRSPWLARVFSQTTSEPSLRV